MSTFTRREQVFVYHDLWGFLLEMSADVLAFIRRFEGGTSVLHAVDGAPFPNEQADGFVQALRRHQILVAPGADELQAVSAGYPVHAPWCVVFEIADDHVEVVHGRQPVGPREIVSLRGPEAALWRAIDGSRSCADLASEFGAALFPDRVVESERQRAVYGLIASWVHSDRQWLRLSEVPDQLQLGRRPAYLSSTMPYPALSESGPADPFSEQQGIVSNESYHEGLEDGAEAQFEDVETTLSHLFRDPHPALSGRAWGGAFLDALCKRGMWPDGGDVIEVGGGLGWFARRLLEHADALERSPASYTICDITPTLQRAQREQIKAWPSARCMTLDAERLELPPASVDLLISNEVIADLRTAWMERDGDSWTPGPASEAAQSWRLPLDDAPERCALNIGAFSMVQRIADVLRPGGAAILTEFGGPNQYPIESTHLDHPEFSIHFGHVHHVARACGLEAEVIDIPRFIDLQGDMLALRSTRTWWVNLRFALAQRGVQIDKRAWTKDAFEETLGDASQQLRGLRWQPLSERVMGLVPGEFWAVILKRPTED